MSRIGKLRQGEGTVVKGKLEGLESTGLMCGYQQNEAEEDVREEWKQRKLGRSLNLASLHQNFHSFSSLTRFDNLVRQGFQPSLF
jgi:hypothetical protein